MYKDIDTKRNFLEVTDAEVAADWKLGMARSAAKLLVVRGDIMEGIKRGDWGIFRGFVLDSMAEHLYIASDLRTPRCELVSVKNIEEVGTERYEHDSFGPGSTYNESAIQGTIACRCGKSARFSYSISVGELIYTIANSPEWA